jgi:hypothetical protein
MGTMRGYPCFGYLRPSADKNDLIITEARRLAPQIIGARFEDHHVAGITVKACVASRRTGYWRIVSIDIRIASLGNDLAACGLRLVGLRSRNERAFRGLNLT